VVSSVELPSALNQFASISPEITEDISSAEFMTAGEFTYFTEKYVRRIKLDKNTTPEGNLEIETTEIPGPEEAEIPIFLQAYPNLGLIPTNPKWTVIVAMNGIGEDAQTFLRLCVDIQDNIKRAENPDKVSYFSEFDNEIKKNKRRKEAALKFYEDNESLVNETFRKLIGNC
jgi:hypothetical protein